MNALIPVPPRSVDSFGGIVLVDPQFESERIGEYAGHVTKIDIIFETREEWRLCIAPRLSIDRSAILTSTDVEHSGLAVDLIGLLGHSIYVPKSDILILETRAPMSRCVTYLSRDADFELDFLRQEYGQRVDLKNARKAELSA